MLVSPPRDLPSRASFRRNRCRRRTRRSSAPARFRRAARLSRSQPPLLPGLFLLGGGFFQSLHDVLADEHPGGVVVRADGRGVHADQGQVRPAPAGGLSDQALQQGGEDTGVPPDPEAPVDGRPRPELARRLTPLRAGPDRQIIPSNCSQPLGYGPYSPIGRNGSINFHCSSVSCLRVTTVFLPDPPSRRTRIETDHNITQALGRVRGAAGPARFAGPPPRRGRGSARVSAGTGSRSTAVVPLCRLGRVYGSLAGRDHGALRARRGAYKAPRRAPDLSERRRSARWSRAGSADYVPR
ncbi:hypothetical protein SHIRM173S_09227 [Streptomyces hirsutus]